MSPGTKKALIIGGLAVTGYFLYTKLGPGASSGGSLNPQQLAYVDNAMAAIPNWAGTYQSVMRAQLTPDNLNNLYTLLGIWNSGGTVPDALNQWWWAYSGAYGLK